MLNFNLFNNLKVLYVDDEPENLQAFSYALIDECDVATYESPSQALLAIEEDPGIAVVVSDIRMPEMDGFEFLHRAAKISPFTANLILTGHTDESLAIKALNGQLCVGYHKKDHAFAGNNLVGIIRDAALRYAERHSREILTANATLIVKRLMRLKDRAYTHEHVHNVELLCRYLLPYLDIPVIDREILLLSAIFHDIGKIVVREDAAPPRAEMPFEDTRETREHVMYSGEILRGLRGLEKCWLAAVDHHEHWDGTGFPSGKRGEEISAFGRILAVVNFFDMAATERVSKRAQPPSEIVAQLESEAGKKFDPVIVKAFTQMWRDSRAHIEEHYRAQNEPLVGRSRPPLARTIPSVRPPVHGEAGSVEVSADDIGRLCAALRGLAETQNDSGAVRNVWKQHDLAFMLARLEERLRSEGRTRAERQSKLNIQ